MGKKIQNIGRYVMDGKTLGKGTFARVEQATHSVTGCKVAIKVIDTRKIKEEHIKNNLHREARILGQLRHPNIVRLYETLKVTATTLYCLVMEFAGGGDLNAFIKSQKDGKLSEDVSRPLVRQLVSALHYLHERAVCHRDLKMENVMLDDKQKVIKLVDFGLSNTFTPDHLMQTHCGSPEYAAPELFDKNQKYGAEIDIWSLGIIMYAMHVGHMPFETPYTDQYRRQKLQQQIERGLVLEHEREMCNLSAECQDLLHKVIEVQADVRLPLLDIEIHPWVSLNATLPFFPFLTIPRDKNMKCQTVDELSSLLDVNRKKLEPQLHEGKCDEMSAMFNMLLDRKRREDGIYDIDYTVVKIENKKNEKNRPKKDAKKDGSSKSLNMVIAPPCSPCSSEISLSSMRDSVRSSSSRKSLRVPGAITINAPSTTELDKVHESTTSANFDLLALCSTPSWLGTDRRRSRRKKKTSHAPAIAKEGTTATLAEAVSGFGSALAHSLGAPELTNSLQVPLAPNPTDGQSTPLHGILHDNNHLPPPPSTSLTRSNSLKAPSKKVTMTFNRMALSRENSLKVPGRQGTGRRRQSMFNFSHRDSIMPHASNDDTQLHIRIDYSPSLTKAERKSSICIIENVISPPASPVLQKPQCAEARQECPVTPIATVTMKDSNDAKQQASGETSTIDPNSTLSRCNVPHTDYNSFVIEQRRNSPVPRPVRLGIKESYSQTPSQNPHNGPKSTSEVNKIECCNPCSDVLSHDYYSVSNSSEALIKVTRKNSPISEACSKLGKNASTLCSRRSRNCENDHRDLELGDNSAQSWRCKTRPPFFDASLLCSKMASMFPSYSASSPTINGGDSDSDSSDSLLESMQINNLATLSDKETPDVSGLNDDVFLRGFSDEISNNNLGRLWPTVTAATALPHNHSRTVQNHVPSKHECLSCRNSKTMPVHSGILAQNESSGYGRESVITSSPQSMHRKITQQNNSCSETDFVSRDNCDMQNIQTVCKIQTPHVPCTESESQIPPLLPECPDIPRQSPVLGVPSSHISILSSALPKPPQRGLFQTPLARIESFTSHDDDFQVCDSLVHTVRNALRSKSPFHYLNRKDKNKVPKIKRRFSLKALMEKATPNNKEHRLEPCVTEAVLECNSDHNSESSTDRLTSSPKTAKVHPKGELDNSGTINNRGKVGKSPHHICHTTDRSLHPSPTPSLKPYKRNAVKSKSLPWRRNFTNFLRKRKSAKHIYEQEIKSQHVSSNSNGHARIPAARIDNLVNRGDVSSTNINKPLTFVHTVTDCQQSVGPPTPSNEAAKVFDFSSAPSSSPQNKHRFITWGRCRECTRSHSSSEEGSEAAVMEEGVDLKLTAMLTNCLTEDLHQTNACC